MGMFDSLYPSTTSNEEWQTKAYACQLDRFYVGDVVPPILGVDATDYQVEVIGGPGDRDAFATIRGGRLASLGVRRDKRWPRVDYYGHVVEGSAADTRAQG